MKASSESRGIAVLILNPLTAELNPSAQRCRDFFLLEILIFKGLIERRFYNLFGV
jgi:hypothetical protein